MVSDLKSLNDAFGRDGAVTFVDHELGGIAARLSSGRAEAHVALHGAHVLSFVPAGGRDVLWMSPEARIADDRGIRGGIPVCWPWFAAHATDPAKPDHGFVRKRPWRVSRVAAGEGRVEIEFANITRPADEHLWDGQADLSLTVTLTDRLTLDLTTRNTGAKPLALTQALHSYFSVGAIAETEVAGLEGVSYLDKLQDFARVAQSGVIRFAGEVDRIYEDTEGEVAILDRRNARVIRIAKSGSRSTVVWNPAVEKSLRLSDMTPDGYLGMVCVETTNAGGDVITLKPREEHRLSMTVGVEPLTGSG